MGTVTGRVGLIKPDDADYKQVQDLNDNADKLDAGLGVPWVADGALPTVQYHGAMFKELTSGKEFILKSDGLGGYTKVPTTATPGIINHYSYTVPGSPLTATALDNSWNTISGAIKIWTPDRNGIAIARFIIDITSPSGGGTQNFHFRIQSLTNSQTGPYRIPINTRYGVTSASFMFHTVAGTPFTLQLGFFNENQTNSSITNLQFFVDSSAVLT